MSRDQVRRAVWEKLRRVATPDSRFHWDFSFFIPDFEGSRETIDRLISHDLYQAAKILFITPDNCLEDLRWFALSAGKTVLVSTYGIKRGFVLLDPVKILKEDYRYAATLDGMERVGQPVTLDQIQKLGQLDLLVTGASAVNYNGVRFGKGHGYFDLEWAILFSINAVGIRTPVVAVVHDCQVVPRHLEPSEFDTVCDLIFTPHRVISVPDPRKPTCGVVWERLEEGMLESIPPLLELRSWQERTNKGD